MRIEIERDGNRVGLRLPCTEENMQAAELAVGITNPTDTCVKLAEMDKRFPALQTLVGRVHNLDHLNLLARMMDGLFGSEYDQFQAAVSLTGATELRDIINLTQNVTNYSLIRPEDTLTEIGRSHYLNIHGAYPSSEEDKLNFPQIAIDLITSGKGVQTPFGIVFDNGLACSAQFNGQNIPDYYDRDFVFNCKLSCGDADEYLFLPCHPDEIGKAVHRLGLGIGSNCALSIEDTQYQDTMQLIEKMDELTVADLAELNVLAKQMESFKSGDIRKLAAMWDYALHTVSTDPIPGMIALARHMDDFIFAPGITDDEQLGVYLIQKSGLYAYDSRLEEYYCYWNLGSDAFDRQQELYIEDGYIGLSGEIQLGEIFDLHEMSDLEAVL